MDSKQTTPCKLSHKMEPLSGVEPDPEANRVTVGFMSSRLPRVME